MGWTSGYSSKREMIAELTRSFTGAQGAQYTTLRKCIRGNVLWTVMERNAPDEKSRVILCFLMRTESPGNWANKEMDELMHPYYYSCPVSYLSLVPDNGRYTNQEWRSKVRAHAAQRNL